MLNGKSSFSHVIITRVVSGKFLHHHWVFVLIVLAVFAGSQPALGSNKRKCLIALGALAVAGAAGFGIWALSESGSDELPDLTEESQLRPSVSFNESEKLFSQISKIEGLNFKSQNGCIGRAHKVARFLEGRGIDSEKLFIQAKTAPGGISLVPMINGKWTMHSTNIVSVTKASGETKDYVLDPAVANGPLPLDLYLDRILNSQKLLRTQGVFYLGSSGGGSVPSPNEAEYWVHRGPRYTLSPFRSSSDRGKGWLRSEMEQANEILEKNR